MRVRTGSKLEVLELGGAVALPGNFWEKALVF